MKQVKTLIVLILLVIPIVNAQVDDYSDYDVLDMTIRADAKLRLSSSSGSPYVQELIAEMTFVPLDSAQNEIRLLDTRSNPNAEVSQKIGQIRFEWENIRKDEISLGYTADIRSRNIFPKVRNFISFPILSFSAEERKYVKPSKKIIVTPKIEAKAKEIIGDEKDLFQVIYKLAEWTRTNIDYDLNTLTEEAVQDSGWVLENRQGVCDEMTNLFISFLRSVGIPAKFIGGMVYTNIGYEWGAHGWAEVYLPNFGWVPYDVTFGEYGWINPSHIKLKESVDSSESSITYNWRSVNTDLEPLGIELDVQLFSKGAKADELVELKIIPFEKEVRFNSFVPIRVNVKNKNNFYLSQPIIVKKAPGLTEENIKVVSIEPNSETNVYWILEIPGGDENLVYTSQIEVDAPLGRLASSEIKYFKAGKSYSLDKAQELLDGLEDQDSGSSFLVGLSCTSDKQEYFPYEPASFSCKIENNGVKSLDDLNVCLNGDCIVANLDVGKKQILNFNLDEMKEDVYFVAKNKDVIKYFYPDIIIKGIPKITISDINSPETIKYSEIGVVSFIMEANIEVFNVTIKLGNYGATTVDKFKGKQKISIPFEAHAFAGSKSKDIFVKYYDANGREYKVNESFDMQVENIGFLKKIGFWIGRLFK